MRIARRRIGFFAIAQILAAIILGPYQALGQDDTHGLGYEPDDLSSMTAMPSVPRFRGFLPAFYDLSPAFPPPGDQGKQGSCVAWSVGYALRGYYHHQRTRTSYADPQNLFSPAYIFNQLVRTPDCQGGSKIIMALEILKNEGVATLADFPYDDRSCIRKPGGDTKRRAADHAIVDYRLIKQSGPDVLDNVKGALLAGHPVVVGLNIQGRPMMRLRGTEVYDLDPPEKFTGHAVVMTGYDDRTQVFKFINSWGSRWGDHGFGRISYRSFAAILHGAFRADDGKGPMPAVSASGIVPAPTPTPSPSPSPSPGPIPAPMPAPAPTPAPARATDLSGLVQALDAKAREFTCSRVFLDSRDIGATVVSGWVSRRADLDAIEALIRSAAVPRVTSAVMLRPWPQCEAMMTLSEVVKGDRGATLVAVNHRGPDFEEGAAMVLRVKTPDFPSYVYVTYLPASGDAVLLYKPRGVVPEPMPPNSTIDLGGGADRRVFRVGPPFGDEMVVAVTSASPLFTDGIPASTTERDYLTALRKTLLYKPDSAQPDRLVDAGILALTTHAKASSPAADPK